MSRQQQSRDCANRTDQKQTYDATADATGTIDAIGSREPKTESRQITDHETLQDREIDSDIPTGSRDQDVSDIDRVYRIAISKSRAAINRDEGASREDLTSWKREPIEGLV